MLKIQNLQYSVAQEGKQTGILRGIDLQVEENQFLVITGPNGGGKTTLAKVIMGLVQPTGGQILWNGEDVTDKFANCRYKLPPVYENLALKVETKAAAEPTTSTTEPTTSTTEPTTSSSTDSTSSTTTSESSSTTSSDSSKTDSSASSTTTSSNSGGTSNSNDNKTYPNNDSPNTGDAMAVGIGAPAFFLGVAFLMVLLKKRNKDEE